MLHESSASAHREPIPLFKTYNETFRRHYNRAVFENQYVYLLFYTLKKAVFQLAAAKAGCRSPL